MAKRVLVTGAAGFIGFHLCKKLHERKDFVIGLDNFNSYYDPPLKKARTKNLSPIQIIEGDICNTQLLKNICQEHRITHIAHLAAQAGVRHSMICPQDYVSSNLEGFVSILEACRENPSIRLTFASSSSVYGLNRKIPFNVDDPTDQPSNLYGATKKANESIAHAYHHLYKIPMSGLRFFTVYGPWGRPDMAYYSFAQKIRAEKPLQVFNFGKMKRDFTYIDDIIDGTVAAIDLESSFEIFNLGNSTPVDLLYLIQVLENTLGKKAIIDFLPMQPGEVLETYADIEKSRRILKFDPKISIEKGISSFVDWFEMFHSH